MLLFSHRKITPTSFHKYFRFVNKKLYSIPTHTLINLKQSFSPFQLFVLKVIVNIKPPVI